MLLFLMPMFSNIQQACWLKPNEFKRDLRDEKAFQLRHQPLVTSPYFDHSPRHVTLSSSFVLVRRTSILIWIFVIETHSYAINYYKILNKVCLIHVVYQHVEGITKMALKSVFLASLKMTH